MAWHAVAQAETVAKFGPRRPNSIETSPLAMFEIIIGIMNGETRPGPLFMRTVCWSSSDFSPPMPLPIITPNRVGSGYCAASMPPSAIAIFAAAMANCV